MSVRPGRIRQRTGSRVLLALIPYVLLAASATAATKKISRENSTSAVSSSSSTLNSRLVVDSNGVVGASGRLTLAAAIARAAASPLPTTIEFDAAALGPSCTIRLAQALVIDTVLSPLRIDASKSKVAITIDAAGCPDAGFVLGGQAQVTMAGLTFRGGRQRVLLCKDHAALSLENVTIVNGDMPGIAAFGQSRLTIVDSRLSENRTHGIEVHGQVNAKLDRVDFNRNGQSGIAGFDNSVITAGHCRLDSNGEWGIVLTDDSRAELGDCTIRKSRFANADVSGTAALTLSNCELLESQRFGLFGTGRSTLRLQGTRIAASGSRGIEAQDRTSITLNTCRIETSADYGLILFGQTRIAATETLFARNSAHGASLRGTASGTFTRCAFVANKFSGLGCLDSHDGGTVTASQCVFRQNGMRPIYRGPLHIDPLVPTPLHIVGARVQCMADPQATIELYFDRAGEATRYVGTIQADQRGRFSVDTTQVPAGWVMTASATLNNATSEFNVIAGSPSAPILDALLGRTGPLSDEGGEINLDMILRRWRPQSRVVFHIDKVPSVAVERYVRFLIQRLPDWTGGNMKPELAIGEASNPPQDEIGIPIHYVEPDAEQLASRGGVTYMRWDSSGFFLPPMEIMLALGRDPQETCPRVLAHEMGHALGLCHARVGLLSRMQGSASPGAGYINDFSPMMTYYDVLALQALHDQRNTASGSVTLRELVQRGTIPAATGTQIAEAKSAVLEPTFSPRPTDPPPSASPSRKNRP